MTLLERGHQAGGPDARELAEVRVGFIPLTDCASVILAARLRGSYRRFAGALHTQPEH